MDKKQFIFAFEAEVHRLLGDNMVRFFARYPSMASAKWVIADFSYDRSGGTASPIEAAAAWFNECCKPQLERAIALDWQELDAFTMAYVGAALWSTNDESNESGGEPLDSNYDVDNIATDSLLAIVAACKRFQEENAALLERARENGYSAARAGHDFWLTRCHHGVGFWDRTELEPRDEWEALGSPRVGEEGWKEWEAIRENSIGNQLTKAAQACGECWIEVGDDGQLHFTGGK